MKSDTRGLGGFGVLTVVLTCLAVQAVFTLPAYGDEIVAWVGPPSPPQGNDFTAIAPGYWHSLALKVDGSIVGWGDVSPLSDYGQAMPPPGNDFTDIATCGWHSLALKSDGSIVGWGRNQSGEATPPLGNDFTDIGAGMNYSIALKSDGSIVGWGSNYYGQATPPAGNDFTAVAAGYLHSVALKSDGSVVCWGRNDYGQATPPAGNDFIAITAGWDHNLALKSDGSIVGWGDNRYGQATPPAGNDFIAFAAGRMHSIALKSDGSIVCWGDNRYGQATPPPGNNFTSVAAGMIYSLALKSVPQNSPPVADAGPDQTIECSCQNGGTQVTLNGAGSSGPDGGPLTHVWTGPFEGSPVAGANPTVRLLPGCQGTYPITLVVNDGQADSVPDEVVITVRDTTPPTITCPATITVEAQGPDGVSADDSAIQAFLGGATVTDNCDPAPDLSHIAPPALFPLGETLVTFTAEDGSGNSSSATSTVTVVDTTPPEIAIVAPQRYGLYAVGSLSLDFSASDLVSGPIAPPDLMATLVDAQSSQPAKPGDVPPAGVYTLTVSAKDGAGNVADPESVMFVVYDPQGGFVTGGGWIESPAGAYEADPALAGKASFGFVSKYKKGASTPTGQTEFVFQAGGLNFHSSSYDWLVVTGSNYARFKGSGTINGSGDYKFMLWAGDGPDTFRIKIWRETAGIEDVVYDNGMDQPIGGGSIVIHTD